MPPADDDRDPRDDDRPRRRRREEDEEYDDRPRPKKAAGTSVGLIIGIVLAVVLCLGGGAAALLLPAVQKVREAAARSTDQNNMKQIALSELNFESATGRMAGPTAVDPNTGQLMPGNSLRVSLLPYIEQDNVYRQFDLTQPWDGPRNQPASGMAIKTYTTPMAPPANPTDTPYRAFVGGGAIFDDEKPTSIMTIQDGTSNTILMVHAEQQVPWAKPDELRYSPTGPLPPLGAKGGAGANVVMADGSVRFLKKTTSEATLRKLITRAGGEVHDPNEF